MSNSGERFKLPRPLYQRLFPGVYYARTAVEVAPREWRERALVRFEKRTPAAAPPVLASAEAPVA